MATNIKRYLDKLDLNTKEFSAKLGFKYTTVLDWVNAKTYPRIDKIDKMANFFGIEKSDLVEDYGSTYNWDCKELLDIFNQLNEQNKKRVIDYADSKLKEQRYTDI
ncbi:helix-turn-helix transcriptional regulator [Lactobacillus jensenii]|nr:helix-turn-helix transcriptional regulator [Lactobacillus jensenii]TVV16276.1 helix-turn-helix transcriptional regulator [Lactobacillus jensenii]